MAKQNKTKWDALSMKDRASFIRIGIKNGITDIEEIKSRYNELESNKFDSGGEKSNLKALIQGVKSYIMDVAQQNQTDFMSDYYDRNHIDTQELSNHIDQAKEGIYDDLYQSTFLFSKNEQKKAFEDNGYILDDSGDYGLVKKAVGKRNLPIYKKNKDAISRNELEVLFNPESAWWLGDYNTELEHSGHYPSTVYTDKEGNLYQNAWDLNDYGISSAGSEGAKYEGLRQLAANALDVIGNPFVVTTGIQPVNYERLLNYAMHKKDPNLVEMAYSKLGDSVRESWNDSALSDLYNNFMVSTRIDNFISKEVRDKVTKDMDFKHYMEAIPFEEFKRNIDKYYSKNEQMEFGYYPKLNKKSLGGNIELPLKNTQPSSYFIPDQQSPFWSTIQNELAKSPTEGPVDINELKRRQAWTETRGDDNAVSPKGAEGRYQIMPNVLKEYEEKTGDKGDLSDPVYNERVRDWQIKRIQQSRTVNNNNPTDSVLWGKTMAAYNWGIGNLGDALVGAKNDNIDIYNTFDWVNPKYLPKETIDYVNFILRNKDSGAHRTNEQYNNRKTSYDTGGELDGLEGLPVFMYRPEYMQQAAQDYITDNQVFGDYNIPEVEVSRQGKKLPSVNSKEGKDRIKFLAQRIANGDSTLDAVPTKYKKNVERYLSGIEFGKEVAKREGYEGLQAFATAAPLAAVPGIFSTMAAATPTASAVINPSSLMNPITKGQLAKQLALDMGWGITGYEGTNKLSESITGKPFNQAAYDQLTLGLSPEDVERNRELGEAVLDMANPGGWLGLNPATNILRKTAKTTKNIASGVYKTVTNPQYRRNHMFNSIDPYSYVGIIPRGSKALYRMITDEPMHVDFPKFLKERAHNRVEYKDRGRIDAWRIYNHLPQLYNTYTKTANGTYRYNLPSILQDSSYPGYVSGIRYDGITGAGAGLTGEIRTELGKTAEGNIISLETIRDTWDLNPFRKIFENSRIPILRRIGDFEMGKLYGGTPFEMITDMITIQNSPTSRIIDPILNPEEYQAAVKASRMDIERVRRTNRKLLEDFDRRFEYIPLDAPIPDILKEGEVPIGRLKMPNRKKIKK